MHASLDAPVFNPDQVKFERLFSKPYLEKAVDYLKQQGVDIPEEHLQHLSPLGWEHINLTGDYVWNLLQATSFDKLRPLRVRKNKHS